jgi:hypothetical protein
MNLQKYKELVLMQAHLAQLCTNAKANHNNKLLLYYKNKLSEITKQIEDIEDVYVLIDGERL